MQGISQVYVEILLLGLYEKRIFKARQWIGYVMLVFELVIIRRLRRSQELRKV